VDQVGERCDERPVAVVLVEVGTYRFFDFFDA
jgi:hypothetical protein